MQAERAHEHTHSPTPQPGVAGRTRNPSLNTHTHTAHPCQEWLGARRARTQTRTPQHPSQEWRGAAETGAQTHTATLRIPARSGRVQAERAHQPTHSPTPQPGVGGWSRNPSPNTHTHTAHPCREWLGASGARTRAHTQPNTPARSGGAQPKPEPRSGGAQPKPKPNHNPDPNTSATQQWETQCPWSGTEAARAMQATRPTEIRRPGVRLHPKACAALGLEAERATPKHLGTPVPRTGMHAFGTGYARKSSEPLGEDVRKHGGPPSRHDKQSRWRRSALPVLPGAALLGATSHV